MVTSVPYESSVAVKRPVLVGWCAECRIVDDPYTPHTTCPNDHDHWTPSHPMRGYDPRFHKRLMWKCPVCAGYYLTRVGLLNHEHGDWEP